MAESRNRSKIMRGSTPWSHGFMLGEAKGRVCASIGCDTILSIYNREDWCAACVRSWESERDRRRAERELAVGIRRCRWCTEKLGVYAKHNQIYCCDEHQRLSYNARRRGYE